MIVLGHVVTMSVQRGRQVFLETMRMAVFGHE